MLYRLMGRDASLAAHRDYLETYRDSKDHPLLEEYLAVMRDNAPDTAAFDALVKQWFYGNVVPQYLVEESDVVKVKDGWEVHAKVRNTGTGTAAIDVAAETGERFPKKRTKENEWRDARATVLIALTIPVCLLATFCALHLASRSINVISLAGLAFAVGMVVDNSIVVLESIDTWRNRVDSMSEAAMRGVGEVWGALVASTATTAAVFIPVILWQDEVGELLVLM